MRCLLRHSGVWQERQRKRRISAAIVELQKVRIEYRKAYDAWLEARHARIRAEQEAAE